MDHAGLSFTNQACGQLSYLSHRAIHCTKPDAVASGVWGDIDDFRPAMNVVTAVSSEIAGLDGEFDYCPDFPRRRSVDFEAKPPAANIDDPRLDTGGSGAGPYVGNKTCNPCARQTATGGLPGVAMETNSLW